ncbi:MAG: hypothetical protein N2643_04535 [Endomicrobia bacterium]|nr:hypothetical protein [Endomicrobiia bacterium]
MLKKKNYITNKKTNNKILSKDKIKKYTKFTKFIAYIIVVLLLLTYLPTPVWHFPDGIGYYSYLPAIFKYKNYDFYNTIKTYTSGIIGTTQNGFVINDFDIGSSIVWTFVYLISNLFENEKISIIFINFFSSILGLSSLFVFYIFITEKLNFSKFFSFYICGCLLLGTPLLFYTYTIPQNPHTIAAFLCSLYFIFWISTIGNLSIKRFLFLGILLGIISTLRLQRIILFIPVFLELILEILNTKGVKFLKRFFLILLVFTISFILGFSPSLINSKIIFSQFTIPKLYTLSLNKYIFHSIYEVLFSSYHSVVLWTPIILISIIGLIVGIKQHKIITLSFIMIFILDTIIIGLTISPGGGSSFGIRYYTDLIFIFGIGIYFLLNYLRNSKLYFIIISSILCLWTFVLFILASTNKIDLLEVYETKSFFSNVILGIKNLTISFKPRYLFNEIDQYIFLSIILFLTFFIVLKTYSLLCNKKIYLLFIIAISHLFFFNYSLIKAGILNRIVYKKEVFENSLSLEDYQKFYTLAGLKVRLKYYKITKQKNKFEFYNLLKEKLKPKSYFGKKIFNIFYNET